MEGISKVKGPKAGSITQCQAAGAEKGLGSYWAGDVGGDKLNGMPVRWPWLNAVGRGQSWKVNEQESDLIRDVL